MRAMQAEGSRVVAQEVRSLSIASRDTVPAARANVRKLAALRRITAASHVAGGSSMPNIAPKLSADAILTAGSNAPMCRTDEPHGDGR